MRFFSYWYDKTIGWSAHRHAPYYLAAVSFAESSFFPIPPDVMLLSMGLAKPSSSWRYALIATIFSVLGGIFGYLIGYLGIELIEPLIHGSSYAANYEKISSWFSYYGVWIVILAGFTPLPYKLFTITAGVMQMPFLPFILGSILGRGLRFFLVSGIMYFAGKRIQNKLRHYVDAIGWSTVIIFVIVYFFYRWKS
ncbi:YqaA family protein [Legionella impletisoli]|uniref:YqaA family protein n=1 Tax=Legionella impletisoli TaxID=343510 RepID=UPI00104152DE|nr:YqaA family protein [Legionella impletisoli]